VRKSDWVQASLLILSLCFAIVHDVLAAPLYWTFAWALLIMAVLFVLAGAAGAMPGEKRREEGESEEIGTEGLVEELRWRMRLGGSLSPEELEERIFQVGE